MATSRIDVTSDEIINIKCCLCLEDNRTREADKYCVNCNNYYCTPCTDMHKKFPSMKRHKLLDKADFRSLSSDGSLPSFVTQRCSVHPAKVVDMYCAAHDEVACASCIALTHRLCTTIHSIPEEVDQLYKTIELTKMKQNIHETKKAMEETKKAKDKKMKELKKVFENEVKSVKDFKQELQTLLDSTEQETLRELKQQFDTVNNRLQDEIKVIKYLIDAMDEVSAQLKKSEGNKAEQFVSLKTAKKKTSEAEDVRREQTKKTEETVSFVPDQSIKPFLQQLQNLGKVSSKQQNIPKKKDGLYKVKQQKTINVKLANDISGCSIFGSCIADGSLLLTDYFSKKLKQLDLSTETAKDYVELPAPPIAVCLISKTEAAVTLRNNTVQFVSLGNKLTLTSKLVMSHHCQGLAYVDGKLIITDCGKSVYIHDMNGQELTRISTDASGKNVFQFTKHITFSAGNDRVFVADECNGLVILDTQGNHLSTLTYPSMSGVIGVCTDGSNLFACGYSSGNIVQIGQDNKLLGELATVQYPLSLCFDYDKTRIIVTHGDGITVLDLE